MAKCLPFTDERVEHRAYPIRSVGLIGGRRRHYDLHRTATAAAAKEIRHPRTVATAVRSVISSFSIRPLVAFVTWTDGGFWGLTLDAVRPLSVPTKGGRMAFRFELRLPDGDDTGTFETAVPDWQTGDTVIASGNVHYRVVSVV